MDSFINKAATPPTGRLHGAPPSAGVSAATGTHWGPAALLEAGPQ